MEDFANILHRDYGLKPQGKSAPMASSKSSSVITNPGLPSRPGASGRAKTASGRSGRSSTTPGLGETLQTDLLFGGNGASKPSGRSAFGSDSVGGASVAYDDVFGGPPKFASPSYASQSSSMQDYDGIFRVPTKVSPSSKGSSLPVFDAPLYDDDIFGGVPGTKNAGVVYNDVFNGAAASSTPFEDLLGGFGAGESTARTTPRTSSQRTTALNSGASDSAFDELLPGFGAAEPARSRSAGDAKRSPRISSGLVNDSPRRPAVEPEPVVSSSSSSSSASPFSDLDPFNIPPRPPSGIGKKASTNGMGEYEVSTSVPTAPVAAVKSTNTSLKRNETGSPARSTDSKDSSDVKSVRRNHPSNSSMKEHVKSSLNNFKAEHDESNNGSVQAAATRSPRRDQRLFHEETVSSINHKGEEQMRFSKREKNRNADEFWITVNDVKLVTQPSAAPPPSRPPPPPGSKSGPTSKRPAADVKQEVRQDSPRNRHEFTVPQQSGGSPWQASRSAFESSAKANANNAASVIDELEDFVSGGSRSWRETKGDASSPIADEEAAERSAAVAASAAAMKEAMERAEAKLRLAKEAREKERDERDRDGKAAKDREEKERNHKGREREDKDKESKISREALETEGREKEDKDKEARDRWRKEREEKEREREREKDRIAVERATQEARERAAVEARERAERVAAEARDRTERAAVERATLEARERAAIEARERAVERAAVDRAAAEARARAGRAAFERANAEVRERAASEARKRVERAAAEKATAAAREHQRSNEDDLESFFKAGSRANSAPRQRPAATDTSSDARQANKGFPSEGQWKSSSGPASVRKVASTTNMADDWTSMFSAVPSSSDFQEMEGETAERRKARWERHHRTLERAAKALDEKNQRDLQSQREQAERHRAGETLDSEIKRWAAGKEGNLRALLSTLQYVLWPECGWQTVSLTDLITAAAVKKAYRKATLCVHPDKVQQKGATIQQKYIAEKVFDLLKEASNKFNLEELF